MGQMKKKTTKKPLKKSIVIWATGWYSNRHNIRKAGIMANNVDDLRKMLELLGCTDFSLEKVCKVKITLL